MVATGSFPLGKRRSMKKTTTSSRTVRGRFRRITQKQIEAAARADQDNRPLNPADLGRMKRTPQVKIIRRALGISQEDFAARYNIPIGTLRDWEQGRVVPDQAARAYLTVIAREPDAVRRALNSPSQRQR
jgi:putative transcriptional regulator